MALMSPEAYAASLRRRNVKIFYLGERITDVVDHPAVRPSFNTIALQYKLALDPGVAPLLTARSHLTGETVNIANHVFQSVSDLVQRLRMERYVAQRTARGALRSPGMDAFNALHGVTWECDRAHGTEYHRRLNDYLRFVQAGDLAVSGAMTDVKGDRGLRPHEQPDPDAFLHVVEERPDGIVVTGAKIHQTSAVHCHEHLVVPGRTMNEHATKYAVAFAVPADAEGIVHLYSRQPSDTRKLEGGSIDVGIAEYGGNESLMIFDNVFVPWERVFLYGETEFTTPIVERFGSLHRACYGGCKAGIADVLIGATALMAEYNGLVDKRAIQDKLTEMMHLTETMYACSLACAVEGKQLASGGYLIDLTYANVGKLNVTRFPFEIARLAIDVTGGISITLPSEREYRDPELGPLVEKYLRANRKIPTEHRLRMARLVENLTLGPGGVYFLVESVHGAGSPDAQRITIRRELAGHLEDCKSFARGLAGVPQ
jgi:4-hydroxybutyryl-CoA dehydratase/vinylacetyl-CoA-Delta-isomerase